MQAGDTAAKTINGVTYECALFPLDYMNCTQVPSAGAYSHCCGTATDWKGNGNRYPYYAPVSCHRISLSGSDNIAKYVSDDQVVTPSGLSYISFLFMHDNSVPSNTRFAQGELIGRTGTAGNVTGDHLHLDQCFGQSITLVNSGITCSGGSTCWEVQNGYMPQYVYFITGDETIVNLQGQLFTNVDHYTPGPGPGPGPGGDNLPAWFFFGLSAGRKKAY